MPVWPRCFAVVLLTWALSAGVAAAADVRGWTHDGEARIAFDFGGDVGYAVEQGSNTVTLTFDRPVEGAFDRALRRLAGKVSAIERLEGGTRLQLTLTGPAAIEDIQTDGVVVLILRPPDAPVGDDPATPVDPVADGAAPPGEPAVTDPDRVAGAVELPTVNVRGGEHEGYSRLVFDWSRNVDYFVARDDQRVTIAFDLPANADFSAARFSRLPNITDIEQIASRPGLTVAVEVPATVRVRHFYNGSRIVLDVLDSGQSAGQPLASLDAFEDEAPPVPPGIDIPPEADDGTDATMAAPGPDIAAAETGDAAADADLPTDGFADQPDVAERPAAAASAIEPPATEGVEEAPPADEPPAGEPEPSAGEPDTEPVFQAQGVLRLDAGPESRLAVFERAGALWVVLDADVALDASALLAAGEAALGPGELVAVNEGVAMRFPASRHADLIVGREDAVWLVGQSQPSSDRPAPLSIESQPDFVLGSRLFIPAGEDSRPIRVVDPVVGDELQVVPLSDPGARVSPGRLLGDVRLLATEQGIAGKLLRDDGVIRRTHEGMEITGPEGLRLSPEEDAMALASDGSRDAFLLELPDQAPTDADYLEQRQALQRSVVEVPDDQRPETRFALAGLHFAHGYTEEAQGVLDLLAEELPDATYTPEFQLFRGATRLLTGNLDGAEEDLSLRTLDPYRETLLWRAALAAERGDWATAHRSFEAAGALWEDYPPALRDRMVIWAAQAAVQAEDVTGARDILDWLYGATRGRSDDWPEVTYLRGEVARLAGNPTVAEAAWEVTVESGDRLYRTLAEMARAEMRLTTGDLTVEEAVDVYEGLRFAWRGDELELRILSRLGSLYFDADQYAEALSVWQRALDLYPDSRQADDLRRQREARFAELYTSDRLSRAPIVDALTLFEENRELVPEGLVGDRMIETLAEELVAIDYLDRADSLFAELIDERLAGVEQARLATRLAGIRLVDNRPEAALETLDATEGDVRGEAMVQERRLLRAHALSELGRPQDALAALENDDSELAHAARLDIGWAARDWPVAADALAELIGPPPPLGEAADDATAQLLLNYGIALALAEDREGLDRLAIAFGPAMTGRAEAEVFEVLTRRSAGVATPTDLAAVRRQVAQVDLFGAFLETYRSGQTLGAPTATN